MEKLVEVGILFDYYGELLSNKQRSMVDKYYNEDLSLTEIGDIYGVTKQAVSENIKRAEKRLYAFEKKLNLMKRSQRTLELLDYIKSDLQGCANLESDCAKEILRKIDEFIKEDMGEL
ncbi:YlxM family DNA-binding protein [Lagierella sp.]|uniref:YlxM family DNA-binding protein n=1 Tax=Lagierella sp. TaxID=2849657 RepID=UPI00262FB0AC|nr:sigma factor-like helix-turn-helix DNA-binding protein [Lagierella sp.]